MKVCIINNAHVHLDGTDVKIRCQKGRQQHECVAMSRI